MAERDFFTCSLTNNTPFESLGRAWEITVSFRAGDSGGWNMTNLRPVVLRGTTSEIELPRHTMAGPAATQWRLKATAAGIVFQPGNVREIDVSPGSKVVVACDAAAPPLTQGEITRIEELQLAWLERGVWNERMRWHKIAAQFGRGAEKLKELFEGGRAEPHTWRQLYRPAKIRADVADAAVRELLERSPAFRVDVYWRALDRFPGGNADMLTIRYRFDLSRAAESKVTVTVFQNWDGTQMITAGVTPERPSRMVSRDAAGTMARFSGLFCALKRRDSECHIFDDHSTDSDEYNTEWSSVEVLLFDPEHAEAPLARLHQSCIMGPQWREEMDAPVFVAPDAGQGAMIAFVTDAVGMGRVGQWSGDVDEEGCEGQSVAGEDFAKATKGKRELTTEVGHSYAHPFYLP